MSPVTHLLASWLIAAQATDTPRDCRLVTLAGVLPDLDGLGLLVDLANQALGRQETWYYGRYHHFLLHGILGGLALALVLALAGRRHIRVALLALAVFHLHLLCDLVGSRGPSPDDLWPIHYLAPWHNYPMWVWHGQWPLDGWPNRVISVALFAGCLALAVQLGHSVVAVFSRRVDAVVVPVLRQWWRYLVTR
jgi:inner membrane protein